MIVAIDGPAGAGKSTVCRILAEKLRFLYLDTGAMYRALAWALLQEKIRLPDSDIAKWLPQISVGFSIKDGRLEVLYGGRDISDKIRSPEISEEASRISRLEPVRSYLLDRQRELARQGNIVAEGRDTATVVFPEAEIKVFLTADLQARIQRRRSEYVQKGIEIAFDEMEKQIRERDQADANRALAPMRPAPGAVIIDTSDLDISQVVDRLIEEVQKRFAEG